MRRRTLLDPPFLHLNIMLNRLQPQCQCYRAVPRGEGGTHHCANGAAPSRNPSRCELSLHVVQLIELWQLPTRSTSSPSPMRTMRWPVLNSKLISGENYEVHCDGFPAISPAVATLGECLTYALNMIASAIRTQQLSD